MLIFKRVQACEHFHALDNNCETLPYDINTAMTSPASPNEQRGVAWGNERKPAEKRRKTNNGRGGDDPTFPSSLHYLLSPIPLSPLTRDSFLLASHLSPPLRSSPSPGTKHTPDRLPWKRLTHTLSLARRHTLSLTLSLSLSCSGNACILSLLH